MSSTIIGLGLGASSMWRQNVISRGSTTTSVPTADFIHCRVSSMNESNATGVRSRRAAMAVKRSNSGSVPEFRAPNVSSASCANSRFSPMTILRRACCMKHARTVQASNMERDHD